MSNLRPIISGATSLFTNCGLTLVYILGAHLPWRWVCGIGAALPLTAVLLQPWLPESPVWLMEKGRTDEAKEVSCILVKYYSFGNMVSLKVLRWLRGKSVDIDQEMESLMPNQVRKGLQIKAILKKKGHYKNIFRQTTK